MYNPPNHEKAQESTAELSVFPELRQPEFPLLSRMRETAKSKQQIPPDPAQRRQKQTAPYPHFQKTAPNGQRDAAGPDSTPPPWLPVREIQPGSVPRNQPQESVRRARLQAMRLIVLQKQKSGVEAAYPYHKITVQEEEIRFRYKCYLFVQTYTKKNQDFLTRGLRPSNNAGDSSFTHAEISCSHRTISELLQRRVSAVISSSASMSYT